jgi:uncharacterized protein (DUF4415 family)
MPKAETTRAVVVDGVLHERLPDGTMTPLRGRTDWARVDALTDAEVTAAANADPDARPMSDAEWAAAKIEIPAKVAVGIRLDADVLAWFKAGGAGYQTRINAVLRRYIEARSKAG